MGFIETSRRKGYVNPHALPAPHVIELALTQDRSKDGKLKDEYFAASLNHKFAYANFPRDMLRAVRDVAEFDPYKRGQVIRTITRHMSFRRDDAAESQVGKVYHEYRQNTEGARSRDFVEIFHEEARKWSHSNPEKLQSLAYCGAVDTTADYFTAVAQEARTNPQILHEKVYSDSLQRNITIGKAAHAAIRWVTRNVLYGPTTIKHSDKIRTALEQGSMERFLPFYENQILRRSEGLGMRLRELRRSIKQEPREYLLESQRVNGLGIFFQNITDGGLSTMHTTPGREGLLGNYHKPIAYVEAQIGAIQALEYAADIYPRKRKFYKELAQKIRVSTLRQFYMPDKGYFAAAVDRDEATNKYRQVEALSIMGASVLNSDLFDTCPPEQKRQYIEPIITRLFSDEFLTDAGLRTKAKQHAALLYDPTNPHANAAEYQGSWTVWPALNEDIIFGLKRQGFYRLAQQLENRLVNFVHANSNVEYAFVVPGEVMVDGKRVNLDGVVAQNYKTREEFESLLPEQQAQVVNNRQIITLTAPYPQGDQLWTASAIMRIEHERENGREEKVDPYSWQYALEEKILTQNGLRKIPILTGEDLTLFSDNNYLFVIDEKAGGNLEEQLRNLSEQKRQQLMGLRRTNT